MSLTARRASRRAAAAPPLSHSRRAHAVRKLPGRHQGAVDSDPQVARFESTPGRKSPSCPRRQALEAQRCGQEAYTSTDPGTVCVPAAVVLHPQRCLGRAVHPPRVFSCAAMLGHTDPWSGLHGRRLSRCGEHREKGQARLWGQASLHLLSICVF
ncbi:unnamed protein product [Rangifer tarandus platyrhynchus]|uniref:Uncharacterized protein n=2 Tax=Rangifer tarandus platyrhynchus TaxID=3082113 RepID=A0ABN8Y0D7_RANTA|nr:unnamed protein product [Rangifer tarandus platyrhynchus]CAI9692695.1 unnamed protein product [Rangifer tarandus platyrhynchus]